MPSLNCTKKLIDSGPTMPDRKMSTRKCVTCHGAGRDADPDTNRGIKCSTCEGSGVQVVEVDNTGKYTLRPGEINVKCSSCGGVGIVMDPQHGASQKCEPCGGSGLIPHAVCEVHQCQRRVLPDRNICEVHAFPAARLKGTTGRRAAVMATRKKLEDEAKVSEGMTDAAKEETTP
jgi:DnaJ-class molecular chaperone